MTMTPTRRPTVAVVMNVTEPWETRYLSYYAAVASWSRQVDQVFVVDGHSAEDLLKVPGELYGPLANVEVVRTPETLWGREDRWHAMQSMHNLLFPLCRLGVDRFDAVFLVGADQIAYPGVRAAVECFMARGDCAGGWARFHRSKLRRHGFLRRVDTNGVVVFPAPGPRPLHGWDETLGYATDFPIVPRLRSRFRDPVNGAVKDIFAGPGIDPLGTMEVDCASHGHFWYTLEECMLKVRRWDRGFARFLGQVPATDLQLVASHDLFGFQGSRPRDEVLAWDVPAEFRVLVEHFYTPGMLGGMVLDPSPRLQRAAKWTRAGLVALKRARSARLRATGYPVLVDRHRWVPLDSAEEPEPVDVAAVYAEQDRVRRFPPGELALPGGVERVLRAALHVGG